MKLNKRGHFVAGVVVGVVITLTTTFFTTHHQVVIKESCRWSDEANGLMCDTGWEKNK